jgi:hypothetical protein
MTVTAVSCDLAGLLANAAGVMRKSDRKMRDYYAYSLEEVAINIQAVRSGHIPLQEFIEFYNLKPKETAA